MSIGVISGAAARMRHRLYHLAARSRRWLPGVLASAGGLGILVASSAGDAAEPAACSGQQPCGPDPLGATLAGLVLAMLLIGFVDQLVTAWVAASVAVLTPVYALAYPVLAGPALDNAVITTWAATVSATAWWVGGSVKPVAIPGWAPGGSPEAPNARRIPPRCRPATYAAALLVLGGIALAARGAVSDTDGWYPTGVLLATIGLAAAVRLQRPRSGVVRLLSTPQPATAVLGRAIGYGQTVHLVYPGDAGPGTPPVGQLRFHPVDVDPFPIEPAARDTITPPRQGGALTMPVAAKATLYGIPAPGRWCTLDYGDGARLPIQPWSAAGASVPRGEIVGERVAQRSPLAGRPCARRPRWVAGGVRSEPLRWGRLAIAFLLWIGLTATAGMRWDAHLAVHRHGQEAVADIIEVDRGRETWITVRFTSITGVEIVDAIRRPSTNQPVEVGASMRIRYDPRHPHKPGRVIPADGGEDSSGRWIFTVAAALVPLAAMVGFGLDRWLRRRPAR